ncbi:t [Anaeramoeba flamelloides]|uniref:T n=1 Tax=Anaeramoeba flamelloides TaxID=1746091 RepID=A0ABQ8YYA9_9EUKA|nr:t [Anaeramoeba flamelloides] [Anaeramoeba flamelloides]
MESLKRFDGYLTKLENSQDLLTSFQDLFFEERSKSLHDVFHTKDLLMISNGETKCQGTGIFVSVNQITLRSFSFLLLLRKTLFKKRSLPNHFSIVVWKEYPNKKGTDFLQSIYQNYYCLTNITFISLTSNLFENGELGYWNKDKKGFYNQTHVLYQKKNESDFGSINKYKLEQANLFQMNSKLAKEQIVYDLGDGTRDEEQFQKLFQTVNNTLNHYFGTHIEGFHRDNYDFRNLDLPDFDLNYNQVLNVPLIYELFQVPTESKIEQIISQYIEHKLNNKKIEFQKDEFGNLYSFKYPKKATLTAHIDTVQRIQDFEFMNLQIDTDHHVLLNPGMVLGGDDKSGVYIILHLLLLDELEFNWILTVQEEIGLKGANYFVENNSQLLKKQPTCFVLDSVRSIGVEFKYCRDFQVYKKVWGLAKKKKFIKNYSLGYSDGYEYSKSCDGVIEFTVGNYNIHSKREFVHLPSLANALNLIRELIKLDW